MAIPKSDKIDFESRKFIKKEGYYMLIKCSIQQEVITIPNIYASNNRSPKYMNIELKGETGTITITFGEVNSLFSVMDATSRQKINKETQNLTNIMNLLSLIDIYRIFYPTTTAYTLFSRAHGKFL